MGDFMRSVLGFHMACAALAAIAVATPAAARDPAVSAINLKVTGAGGSSNGDGAWLGVAGLTAPLGPMWGVQGEAGVAGVDGDTTTGLAGHVFKRDPDSYLAGLFVAYASEDSFDLEATRLGAETEFYMGQLTLILKGGYQFSDVIDDTAFGDVELHWYASDNFRLGGGVSFDEAAVVGHAGAEWLLGSTSLPGLALRADAYVGDEDSDSVMAGITYYFGSDASLKDRHRRQDPDSALFSLFQTIERERAAQCPPVQQLQQQKVGPSNGSCVVEEPPG
jgi:hypothetical protein